MPEIANRPGSAREPTAWNADTGSVTPLAGARIGQVASSGLPTWLLPVQRLSCIMGKPCQPGREAIVSALFTILGTGPILMTTRIGKWAILGTLLAVLLAACCSAESPVPNQNLEPESGVVVGRIEAPFAGMPTEDLPALTLFFESTATEEVVVFPIPAGQCDYRASLPQGSYHVYTWLPDYSKRGAYTTCQSGSPCQEHSLQPFAVTLGKETAGIDIADWHDPSGPPIVLVGTVIDGTGAEPRADAVVVIQGRRIVRRWPKHGD